MSAREKLKKYFEENVGKPLSSDELRKEAGISEWARRVRELKNEYGMNIQTHNDRADLKPGQYILVDLSVKPKNVRGISKEVRAQVLDRDGGTCQLCGVAAGEPHPNNDGRPARMHIGHIVDKSHGGSDELSNLQCLCSVCNEGIQNIALPRPSLLQITTTLRRSSKQDQIEALKWLMNKYRDLVKEFTESNK
jgi:hypothetical protein